MLGHAHGKKYFNFYASTKRLTRLINDIDDGRVEYLTWDGNINVAFAIIDKLLD